MNKVLPHYHYETNKLIGYRFYCPGCGYSHVYYTSIFDGNTLVWGFNGSLDCPTFTPSLLNTTGSYADPNFVGPPEIPPTRCHLFVTNGKINYCSDCTHKLNGIQGVEMKVYETT